tara:strand:- start:279 stop:848 length:570 start_codon:yes stop_codon:yes gene_type:complete
MKTLLIDNYDSFTYNLYHHLLSLGCKVEVVRNDKISSKEIFKRKYKKIVISPGPGTPIQAGNCLKIVRNVSKKIPILGVCLGHQIIGEAYGAKIINAKKLMHGKTSKILHNKIGIFKGVNKNLVGTRYHSLIIDRKTLNNDFIITAKTKENIIMGIMHKKYNLHGVQFHPESINTQEGMKLIKNFLNYK